MDVHVITRRYPGLASFEHVEGVPVHRIRIPGPKPLASLSFTAGAIARIVRLRPDVIHAHELLSPTTVALAAGQLVRSPVVVKVLISGEIRYLREERPLGRQRMGLIRRGVDTFITISRDIDAELERSGVTHTRRRSIANGVDTERFAPAPVEERAALRRELGLSSGPVLSYVGRLEPQKNLPALLTAFHVLRRDHPDATLVLAGEGSQERTLRGLAADGVRFLGRVEDVVPLLRSTDVFVLPSWREGLSNALLEAMACELPVVVTAVGGATEVVTDHISGRLVDPGDVDALRIAMAGLLEDPERRHAMGRRAREVILDRYALEDRIDDFLTLYRELTS